MDNYVAIVFEDEQKAAEGLHGLWRLSDSEQIDIYGAAVIRRDASGNMSVATKATEPGVRTAIGIGFGVILGLIAAAAGPVGVGTALAAGTGIGGAVGATADAVKAGEHQQAASETQFILPSGQAAVIAEVGETTTNAIDNLAAQMNGKVYRRPKSTVLTDRWFGDDSNLYLYPYDYEPGVPPPK